MALVVTGGAAQAAPRLKVLHPFRGVNGADANAGLIADAAGDLFGVTPGGGVGVGVVYELSPPAPGKTH